MYTRIMVPLENSPTDAHIVSHIRDLAKHCKASVVLIHVADGWAARNSGFFSTTPTMIAR